MAKGGKGGGGGSSGSGGDTGSINGNKRDNVLDGTDGADVIDGGGGNDRITGGLGDDTIIGGDGTDTAVFSGLRADYTVTDLGDGTILVSGPDGDDTVSGIEFFEFADITQTLTEVLVPLESNLAAGTIAVGDTSLVSGDSTTVTFDVASTGTAAIPANGAVLLVSTTPDGSGILGVADSVSLTALGAGDSTSASATLDTTGLAPGTYWVAVGVDPDDVVAETDETDNLTEWVQITVAPAVLDLSLTAEVAATSDLDLAGGATLTIDYTVTNASTLGSGDWTLRTVLSRDGVMSDDDIILNDTSGNTAYGETTAFSFTAPTIPEDFSGGDWQVLTQLVFADGSEDMTPADNVASEAITLVEPVADFVLNGADISASDLDLTDGGRITVTYDVTNAGTISPSYLSIRSYLSTDSEISADDLSMLGITGGTYPGLNHTPTTSYYLQEDFPAGDYYLISVVSWGDGTSDATPGDNVIVQSLTLTAPPPPVVDIAVRDVSVLGSSDLDLAPDPYTSPQTYGTLDLEFYLDDLGDPATGDVTLTAWLSGDGTLSGDDVAIWTDTQSAGSLFGAGPAQVLVSADLDASITAGDYQVIVTATTAGDADASNDVAASAPITLIGGPVDFGTEGADVFVSGPGGEIVNLLGGDDVVIAAGDGDVIDGGAGFDTLDFADYTEGVELFADFADPTLLMTQDKTTYEIDGTYTNFERIGGTDFDDLMSFGYANPVEVFLGAGNDMIEGSFGDDVIDAGSGDDFVSGLFGNDQITLGEGADLYGVMRDVYTGAPTGMGDDVIFDFNPAEDTVAIYYDPYLESAPDLAAFVSADPEGTRIDYADDASILLLGVDPADIDSFNLIAVDQSYAVFA